MSLEASTGIDPFDVRSAAPARERVRSDDSDRRDGEDFRAYLKAAQEPDRPEPARPRADADDTRSESAPPPQTNTDAGRTADAERAPQQTSSQSGAAPKSTSQPSSAPSAPAALATPVGETSTPATNASSGSPVTVAQPDAGAAQPSTVIVSDLASSQVTGAAAKTTDAEVTADPELEIADAATGADLDATFAQCPIEAVDETDAAIGGPAPDQTAAAPVPQSNLTPEGLPKQDAHSAAAPDPTASTLLATLIPPAAPQPAPQAPPPANKRDTSTLSPAAAPSAATAPALPTLSPPDLSPQIEGDAATSATANSVSPAQSSTAGAKSATAQGAGSGSAVAAPTHAPAPDGGAPPPPAPPAPDAGSLFASAPQGAAGTTSATQLQTAQTALTQSAAPPQDAVIQVSSRFIERFDGRAQRFDMQLDPVELGRVEVRIEIGADKKVHAVLAAHDSAALSDLMRGRHQLEQALTSAGLDLADEGLSFELAQDNTGAFRDQPGSDDGSRQPRARINNAYLVPVEAETLAALRPTSRYSSRVNLVA